MNELAQLQQEFQQYLLSGKTDINPSVLSTN